MASRLPRRFRPGCHRDGGAVDRIGPARTGPALTARPIIREAGPADFDAAGEVAVAAYRTIDPDLGTYEARLRDVGARVRVATVFVAELDGRIVGTATYVGDAASPLAESDDPDDAGLRMLAVAPDTVGRGIGTALVQEAIARARRDGRRRLVLLSRPTMLAAHAIYSRLGFERAAELDETWSDVTLLGFALRLT